MKKAVLNFLVTVFCRELPAVMDQMLQLAKQASEIDLEDGSKQKTFSYRDFLCMMRSSIVVQLRDLANQDERDLAELETADDAFYTPPNVSAPPPPPPKKRRAALTRVDSASSDGAGCSNTDNDSQVLIVDVDETDDAKEASLPTPRFPPIVLGRKPGVARRLNM